ncbi:MAG: phosphoglyceromutase, partial [Leeuwenhoekiella sp.]
GSKMNLTNQKWYSYPGYNEILTGKADDERINSNAKMYNPNITFLEELNKSRQYDGKVAAFASWDVFPYIINDKRSGIPVNAGYAVAKGENLTEIERFLNKIEPNIPSPFGTSARLDFFTDYYALEYIKRKHPDVIYIANDETDDFAHQGEYDAYLDSAHSADAFLKELWEYTQNDSYYKGKTTFIITCDHGRGTDPLDTWRSHGGDVKGADQTWLLIYGAQAKKDGEIKIEEQLLTSEIAGMIKKMLDFKE